MKPTLILSLVLFLCGCATGSPIDILIPTPKPSVATTEYLGHLLPTNGICANKVYHSLVDTKLEKALVPVRKMELQGLHYAAKGETEIVDSMGSKFSNGIWGSITALLVAAGWLTPRPQEKLKVDAALHHPPPKQQPNA